MRTPSAFLLLWIATLTGASAQAPSIDRVETGNPGIYELSIKKVIDDKKLAGHSWHVVTGVRMVQAITTVPARRCISFGFEYVIVGSPANAEVPIRMVTKFPQPGLRNPETFETTYEHEAVVTRTLGHVHFRSYTLESSWELVPGVWTFELWHRDRKLAEQRFTVTPCPDCRPEDPSARPCEERLATIEASRPAPKKMKRAWSCALAARPISSDRTRVCSRASLHVVQRLSNLGEHTSLSIAARDKA